MANFRNRSVDVHRFAMVPRIEIPRSAFRMQTRRLTAFDSGFLVPIYLTEILPGDTFNLRMTAFCRLATPIVPVMDNIYFETFFFFIPNRLVWTNWVRFMGEQPDPSSSISFTIPQMVSPAGGYPVNSLFDHLGLPTVGQVAGGNTVSHSALPLRCYGLVYNQWFRDENLLTPFNVLFADGPDPSATYTLIRRAKRHDYFTSCLPWTQKGGVAVTLPLGTTATVRTNATDLVTGAQANPVRFLQTPAGAAPANNLAPAFGGGVGAFSTGGAASTAGNGLYPSNLFADLSTATAATINQIRLAFQTQRFLERDARGGTRYTELVRSHFGVISPDARLQRPEFLGGGSTPVNIHPVAQTSSTDAETPQGNLSAFGTALARNHGFTQSFTEHGHILGIGCVRADLTYQQGLRRLWSRSTRFDFAFPVFSYLGEQAVLNKEIYCDGSANDNLTFGFQERYAEYRYHPSEITGLMRSTAASSIDVWHLAQDFSALPLLNGTFINETPPLSRILAVGAAADGQQLIADMFFDVKAARPLPLYGVPGNIDHF